MIKPIYNYFGGVGPNNCIFRGFPYISWDGVLFYSFDSLKFVHRYLYCTYYNIMCLHSFCSITSWASRRNTSPVILPTIIFVFLSMLLCKAYPWELHLFKSSYFYSDISCKVMCPMTSIVFLWRSLLWAGQVIRRHFISSVTRFGERRLSFIIFVSDVKKV